MRTLSVVSYMYEIFNNLILKKNIVIIYILDKGKASKKHFKKMIKNYQYFLSDARISTAIDFILIIQMTDLIHFNYHN